MDVSMEEYLDEMNELASQLEDIGNVYALEQLHLTLISIAVQRGVTLEFSQDLQGAENEYWSNVPP